jgi:CubicO group peptidase (beta-lactamase class C family)
VFLRASSACIVGNRPSYLWQKMSTYARETATFICMTVDSSILSSIDSCFSDFFKSQKSPGLHYALSHNGRVIHATSFGCRRIEPELPVEHLSIFRIASMTKSFATVAVLRLRDLGLLDIDVPLSTLSGDLQLAEPFSSASLGQLMAMKLDLPTDDPWADRLLDATNRDIEPYFALPMLRAGFGSSRCSYSNLSYLLLGRIIALASGRPAMEYISEEIVQPLQMHDTVWNIPEGFSDRAAVGYRVDCDHPCEECRYVCRSDGVVFGGLWSTASDLALWLEFLRGSAPGLSTAESVLSSKSRSELRQPYSSSESKPITSRITGLPLHGRADYGFGLVRHVIAGAEYIAHSGGLPGFGSHMRVHTQTGYGIVALGNGTYCPASEPCADALHYLVSSVVPHIRECSEQVVEIGKAVASFLLSNTSEDTSTLFTNNFWQDNLPEHFVAEIRKNLKELGENVRIRKILPVSGCGGEVLLVGSGGTKTIEFQLAPHLPARVQGLAWLS